MLVSLKEETFADVLKMGYPVVTVDETVDGIHVRQDRFLQSGHAEEKDNKTTWWLPNLQVAIMILTDLSDIRH